MNVLRKKAIIFLFLVAVISTYWIGHIGINMYLVSLSTVVTMYIVFENRNTSKTLVWIMLLNVNPAVGLFFYYLFGGSYEKKRKYQLKHIHDDHLNAKREVKPCEHTDQESIVRLKNERPTLMKLLENASTSMLSTNTKTVIYHNGHDKFSALFESIQKAKTHIHLQYYIFQHDQIGTELSKLLKQKAREGIKVRIIYDSVGSMRISKSILNDLKHAGIEIAAFGKVRFPMFNNKINYRNHRKIVVIDGEVGFVGGMNVGDNYLLPSWRDTHMRLSGESVRDLQILFCNDWMYLKGEDLSSDEYFPTVETSLAKKMSGAIKIIASGPDQQMETIKSSMFSMINSAKKSIHIATPYFVPDEDILSAIKIAAMSGVEVNLLMPSIPDRKIVFYASRSFYKELMEAGVHIYTYNPGFVHSKIVIIDEEIATVGTCNMDMRSFHLNFEVNAFIFNDPCIKDLVNNYKIDVSHSKRCEIQLFQQRRKREKIAESLSRLAAPML